MRDGEPPLPADDRPSDRPPARAIHPLARFLWWCSGSVPEYLRDLPSEHAKFAGIGGAVLSTWCLATFAGGYAVYMMADDADVRLLWGLVAGLVWGLIIFNIDRFLVSSLRKSGDKTFRAIVRSELLPASPRILFAVVIALTIAEPIELRLFAPEIESRVDANRDRLVADRQTSLRRVAEPQVTAWRGELAQLDERLAVSRQRLDTRETEYVEESDGRGGSQTVGVGPLTAIKRAELDRARAENDALIAEQAPRRADLAARVDRAEQDVRDRLATYRASLGSGYLARREALTDLYNERAGVWGAVWGIFVLMVMVEITPLLLKIFAAYGPYDARVALAEQSSIQEASLGRDYRIAIATYHYDLAQQSQRAVELAQSEASTVVRTAKVREAWADFDAAFPVRRHASANDLVRHLRQALSVHLD
jgi:hypothetical protein